MRVQKLSAIGIVVGLQFLSGCGKHISVSGQSLKQKELAAETAKQQNLETSLIQGELAKDSNYTSGKLMPLSEFDMKLLETSVPFKANEDQAHQIRQIAEPSFTEKSDVANAGFNKNSNLVFRAIKILPPSESVHNVSSFKLILNDSYVFVKSGDELEKTLNDLQLCSLPAKRCVGAALEPSDTHLDYDSFWNQAASVHVTAKLFKPEQFDLAYQIEGEGAVYRAKSELSIDLLSLWGVKAADSPGILEESSTAFDKAGLFRKFNFVMGSSFHAGGGRLELSTDADSLAPAVMAKTALKNLINGRPDMVSFKASGGTSIEQKKENSKNSEIKKQIEAQSIPFDEGSEALSASAQTIVSDLGKKLKTSIAKIAQITIVLYYDESKNRDENYKQAGARALAIATELKKQIPEASDQQKIVHSVNSKGVQDLKTLQGSLKIKLVSELGATEKAALTKSLAVDIDTAFGKN